MDSKQNQDEIDALVESAVFAKDDLAKENSRRTIWELAASRGILPASVQGLYDARAKNLYRGVTVPAMNVRGLTYEVARAAFTAALKQKVGAFIFEIARSEMGYTRQKPAEYAACVMAAALREGFQGPVFLQGDHYQVAREKYLSGPAGELNSIKELILESVAAGFLNIDIDASTLVDKARRTEEEQQEANCRVTAEMTGLIRSVEPAGITITIGGEIGEIGKENSTPQDLRAFMQGYLQQLSPGVRGIAKISVQTGTRHGGMVLQDGSIADVHLDFGVLERLSCLARDEYGLGGAVQHGASTLPDEAFPMFPRVGALEVHLATGFQNLIYDSPYFPGELRDRIYAYLLENYAGEMSPGKTREQFFYETRKKGFGPFKEEIWHITEEKRRAIRKALETRFSHFFQRLNVVDTVSLVDRFVVKASSLK